MTSSKISVELPGAGRTAVERKSAAGVWTLLRYRYLPDHLIGELLSKRWIDNAIPFLVLVVAVVVFGLLIPDFFSANALSDLGRQFAEFGLVVLGLTIVMISGGIDLSVASVFTLAVLLSLICVNVEGWPVALSFLAVMALGVVCGAINGYLVGYLRLRAFLTTLVTLIIFRSIYDIVFLHVSTAIISSMADSDLWTYIGEGTLVGVPFSLVVTGVIAVAWHIVLSRMRPGWRLTAVGGARRSAYNAGIKVRRTVCLAYVWSAVLSALAGFLFAARIGSTGADTGVGLEITALTAAVLGGNSLGGGRGSVAKAVIGTVLVLIVTDSLIALSVFRAGELACSAACYRRRVRRRALAEESPQVAVEGLCLAGLFRAPAAALGRSIRASPYALNDKLRSVEHHRAGSDRRPGGRDPRPRRQSLLRQPATATSCASSGRTTSVTRSLPISAAIRSAWLSTARAILLVCIGGMGLYAGVAGQDGHQAHRRDQSHLALDDRRFASEAGRRSRYRAGRTRLLQRGDHPLRNARMAGRRAGEPRQRTHRLLRPETGTTRTDVRETWSSPTAFACARDGNIVLLRRDLGLPRQPLLF